MATRLSCKIHCKEQAQNNENAPRPDFHTRRLQSAWVRRRVRPGNKKARERRLARAAWRSFGEYAFLEDSRYASQQEIVPQFEFLRRAMKLAMRPAGNNVHPRTALTRSR